MDVISMASSVSMNAQQTTSSSSQAATKAGGTAPFQQQLSQYVNQTDGKEVAVVATEATTETAPVDASQLGLVELTAEELIAMIEGLIEQLDELSDAPLTEEDQSALEMLSMQLMAVLQLITVDNQDVNHLLEDHTNLNQLVVSQVSSIKPNNELLMKLQDQLLLLQQVMTDGNVKVVQGQQPEQLVSNVLSQLKQLVSDTKVNAREQLINQLQSAVDENVELAPQTLQKSSLDQLKQLAKQAEYAQLSSQVSTTQAQVNTQTVEVTPVTHLHQVSQIELQTPQTVSLLKGQPQTPGFTMVSQFADTVKSMVFQKFDLSSLNGLTEARIMLTPEHLGGVDIKLSMQNGILTAVFQTETALAKDALENQMAVLRSSLAAQGINVERLEVSQASFANELSWQEQRQQQHTNQSQDEQTDEQQFEEQLELNSVIQELGFGRAVNETI